MSCPVHNLDCRLDEIVTALNTGPDPLAVWTLIVSVLAVIASTSVAYGAYRASRQAVAIASNAESREDRRDALAQANRLNERLVVLVLALEAYEKELIEWNQEPVDYWLSRGATLIDTPVPEPATAAVTSAAYLAELTAQGEDVLQMDLLAGVLYAILTLPPSERPQHLQGLRGRVRRWRNGTESWNDFRRWAAEASLLAQPH